MSFTLPAAACPTAIQPRYVEIIRDFRGDDDDDDEIYNLDDDLTRISIALTGEPGQLLDIINTTQNRFTVSRKPGHYCNICERRHGFNELHGFVEDKCDNCLVYINHDTYHGDEYYSICCPRSTGKQIQLPVNAITPDSLDRVKGNSVRDEEVDGTSNNAEKHKNKKYLKYLINARRRLHYPGYMKTPDKVRTADLLYTELPDHEAGPGCRIIFNVDYLDGSACGMGKSEAAWKSLKDNQSVVVVSYRKTFTEIGL